jgi:hypothetical protein
MDWVLDQYRAHRNPASIRNASKPILQLPAALSYLLFLPLDYEPGGPKRWPLLVFLHGAGEQVPTSSWSPSTGLPSS